jgi:hypothetical protein
MTRFDRRREPAETPRFAMNMHPGVKLLRSQGHEVHGNFDTQTIQVDDYPEMTVGEFQAFIRGYALGQKDRALA